MKTTLKIYFYKAISLLKTFFLIYYWDKTYWFCHLFWKLTNLLSYLLSYSKTILTLSYYYRLAICFVACVYGIGYLFVITLVLLQQMVVYIPKYSGKYKYNFLVITYREYTVTSMCVWVDVTNISCYKKQQL